ncbi:hypothetical protein NQX30_04335 [Candidatus Persebacteraceae bacterium Df01]|jgi:ATP-dependent Clp protease adapter protein ClpS|uniref:Uncharacterized protein n=1 Tax=Candidatus Doriopsillibacter californiensis TaxID=2970740 RepID=A0ABT7QLK2_9GAMM|nr:hypothetical protein [Candidatus Persebacteraceae bacterium Df01]
MKTISVISVREDLDARQLAALLPAAQMATIVPSAGIAVLLTTYVVSDIEAAVELAKGNNFPIVAQVPSHFSYLSALRRRAAEKWPDFNILEWNTAADDVTLQELVTAIVQQLFSQTSPQNSTIALTHKSQIATSSSNSQHHISTPSSKTDTIRPQGDFVSGIDWKRARHLVGASPIFNYLEEAEKAIAANEIANILPLLDMAQQHINVALPERQPFLQTLLLRLSATVRDDIIVVVDSLKAISLSAEEEEIACIKPFLMAFKARCALDGILD